MTLAIFIMLVGHALADGPLQWGAVGEYKRRRCWLGPVAMAAHGFHHGLFVWAATGMWTLGLAEAISHVVIDYAKPVLRFGTLTDQLLHAVCKIAWLALFWMNT